MLVLRRECDGHRKDTVSGKLQNTARNLRLVASRWLFDKYLCLKNQATEIIAAKAAQIESLRAAQENFEKDTSLLATTIDSDKLDIKILQSQEHEQRKRSAALKSQYDAAQSKCVIKLHETEALERQIATNIGLLLNETKLNVRSFGFVL